MAELADADWHTSGRPTDGAATGGVCEANQDGWLRNEVGAKSEATSTTTEPTTGGDDEMEYDTEDTEDPWEDPRIGVLPGYPLTACIMRGRNELQAKTQLSTVEYSVRD